MTIVSLHDRYIGTLLGLACGDALGGPVEFLKRDVIAARFPTASASSPAVAGWASIPGR